MKKHAYLIIAHDNFEILKLLIQSLDDYRNDLFIHIDKKTKEFDTDEVKKILNHSNVYFVDRIKVNWFGFSQIKCTLELLKYAVKVNDYEYYHLLSGVDFPLKNQDYIHDFFNKNVGREFVAFSQPWENGRFKYYHPFNEYYRKRYGIGKVFSKIDNILSKIQSSLKINRFSKTDLVIKKGSNWFSITHDFASFVVESEEEIKSNFKWANGPDELFIQTLLFNSKFKSNIYYLHDDHEVNEESYLGNMRYVDWKRGTPFTFTLNEFNELISAPHLYARKFSERNIDVIHKIREELIKLK